MRPYELCGRAQVSTYAAAAGRIAATPSTPEPAPHRAAPGGGVEKFWIFVDSLQMGPDRSAFCPTGVHFAGGGGKFRPACGPPTRGGSMTESARREQSSPPCHNKTVTPQKTQFLIVLMGPKAVTLSSSPLERPAPRTTNSWPRNGCKLLAALPGLRGQRLCRGGRERGGAAAAAAARAHGPAPAAWPCARSTGAR